MNAERIAQPPGGPSEHFLVEQATKLSTWIAGSVPEAGDPHPRNTMLIVSPSGEVTRYAKIHPFSYAGEDLHYAAGEKIISINIEGVRVTPFICYDLRFPEPFRVAAAETDLFVIVANWPAERREHWRTLLRARAIENQAFVAGVNRTGEGNGLTYAGDSALIDPLGETVTEAQESEQLLVGDVDPGKVSWLRGRFPALADIRPAAYRR